MILVISKRDREQDLRKLWLRSGPETPGLFAKQMLTNDRTVGIIAVSVVRFLLLPEVPSWKRVIQGMKY